MTDLDDLYQEVILDHQKSPRNFGTLDGANRHGEGFNPLCGDQIQLEILVKGDMIEDIKFKGKGCAISVASNSMMTESLKGKSVKEANDLFDRFHSMITQEPGASANPESLGKLAAFKGIWEYPVRVKCAILGWHTLISALKSEDDIVSTE